MVEYFHSWFPKVRIPVLKLVGNTSLSKSSRNRPQRYEIKIRLQNWPKIAKNHLILQFFHQYCVTLRQNTNRRDAAFIFLQDYAGHWIIAVTSTSSKKIPADSIESAGFFYAKTFGRFAFLHYLWATLEDTHARKNSNKFGFLLAYSYLCTRNVCHDDEMTLGSGSFSGISQQLPKRW